MISARILCEPFVGRGAELDHLVLRRRAAGEGHGGLVLVGGEPGIGKSRLVREFKSRVNRRSSLIVSSACRAFAQKPLGPLLDILGQIAHGDSRRLESSSKDERLDAIAAAFEGAAEKRLTVVTIEDLHWADVDLVQTLLVLAQRATTKRLLFVATFRDNELVPAHPLFRWFGELLREQSVSLVTLSRFAEGDTDELISFALGDAVKLSLPVLRAVRERSDGNPLFAEELLRSAVDAQRSGDGSSAVRALPMSLHALIRERLRECSDDERTLLKRASLFGRSFGASGICEVFGGGVSALRPMLERLCGLQLIDPAGEAGESYQFRHALTRDVVYGELPAEAMRPLHLTIAEHLERSADPAAGPEVLAHHFWEAACRNRAAAYYESAGDAAMEVFAYEDAAAFYDRAATGFESDRKAVARVRARAGKALIFAGELDDGLAQYERAVALALELGEVAEAVRSRALMAGHMFDGGRRDSAVELIEDTLPIAARGEASLASRLLTRLAMTLARDARLDEARDALRRVEARALPPNSDTKAEYFLCASELHAQSAELEPWKESFAEGLSIYEALGHPGPMQIAHANFAVQALCVGETALARAHHEIAGEFARTLRFGDQAVLPAQAELYAGNLGAARSIVDATQPSRKFLIRAVQMQVAIPLALALGDEAMLDRYFDPSFPERAGSQSLTPTLARVGAAQALALAAKGRGRDAQTLLARVLESLRTTFGMMLPIAAIAALLPERAGELRSLVAAAAARADDRVNVAFLALLDAVSADRSGNAPAAKERALDGARQFSDIGWPLLEARCLEIAGDRKASLEIYLRCGAIGEARRRELHAMTHAEPNGDVTSLGVLTARERELALLIASGKPNRAAAAELSITEKAVEKYLTSIYAKFGFTSRSQLAAFVASSRSDRES